MWEIILGGIAGLFFTGFGVKVKSTIEDNVTASSDSFTQWDDLFRKYSLSSGVPWPMLKAIAMNESSLGTYPSVARGIATPDDVEGSKSQDGKSWGLMQLTIPTARDFDTLASPTKLNDPDYSVKIASKLLRSLQEQFDQEEFIVKAYNQGAGNTIKEIDGSIAGYAQQYWDRYQRNRKIISDKQGV